jgi:hypothetical protein
MSTHWSRSENDPYPILFSELKERLQRTPFVKVHYPTRRVEKSHMRVYTDGVETRCTRFFHDIGP